MKSIPPSGLLMLVLVAMAWAWFSFRRSTDRLGKFANEVGGSAPEGWSNPSFAGRLEQVEYRCTLINAQRGVSGWAISLPANRLFWWDQCHLFIQKRSPILRISGLLSNRLGFATQKTSDPKFDENFIVQGDAGLANEFVGTEERRKTIQELFELGGWKFIVTDRATSVYFWRLTADQLRRAVPLLGKLPQHRAVLSGADLIGTSAFPIKWLAKLLGIAVLVLVGIGVMWSAAIYFYLR